MVRQPACALDEDRGDGGGQHRDGSAADVGE